MVIKQRKSEDNISLSDSYVQIKHETLLKIVIELIIIIGMGVGVYFTLRFSYIEAKMDDNAKAIIDLDKRKVDWDDYGKWERLRREITPVSLILKKIEDEKQSNTI